MRHLRLALMVILLCLPTSLRAQETPAAVTQAEGVPFLAIQAVRDIEVHNGPGAHFAMVGWLPAGSIARIEGCNADCSWLMIAPAIWIAADEAAPVIAFTLPDGTVVMRIPSVANTLAQSPTATPPTVATATPLLLPANTPTALPVPTQTAVPIPTAIPPTPVVNTGPTYEQICKVDESNMTDPQLQAHAAQFAGQTFTDWRGWVYDVVSRVDGNHDLQIAMEERGIFWGRNVVVENVPANLATSLNVEQPIVFSGRVAKVDYTFEVMCNPMVVDSFVLQEEQAQNCDPSYPDFCLAPGIPDLNCDDEPIRNYARFRVFPPDPHGLDGNDNDGIGCENN